MFHLTLLIATLAAAPIAPVSADTIDATTHAALDSAGVHFSRAFVAGNMAGIVDSYTGDAFLMPNSGRVYRGAEGVRTFYAGGPPAGHRLEATFRRRLAADRVLEVGSWHFLPGGDGATWRSGCYSVVMGLSGDGRWRMEFDTWTDELEAEHLCGAGR
jgi:ketosteroid isomerase-like protein